jgi:hypothetical protein
MKIPGFMFAGATAALIASAHAQQATDTTTSALCISRSRALRCKANSIAQSHYCTISFTPRR